MPRAYWNAASFELTSMLVLATPSETLWLKAKEIVETGGLGAALWVRPTRSSSLTLRSDGEVFNTLSKGHFGVLPHRRYAMRASILPRFRSDQPSLRRAAMGPRTTIALPAARGARV